MALRSKAGIALVLLSTLAAAEGFEFPAVQKRLWRDKPAVLRVDESGIHARRQGEAFDWTWDDIQQLTLTATELRILTYTDSKWRAGRDREWTFEQLPNGKAQEIYPLLRDHLDTRLVPALAVVPAQVLWQMPVKLRQAFGGSEGTLIWGADAVAYQSSQRDQSRTWRIKDIESISSGGPLDLTITTFERQGLWRAGPSEFQFQLKRPMPDDQYQRLWRQVQRSKGLGILQSYRGVN